MKINTKKQPAKTPWLKWALGSLALGGAAVGVQAQTTLFLDTFGTSTVRTTSPYVPQMYLPAAGMDDSSVKFSHGGGFYKFAQPTSVNPSPEDQKSNDIDNGYYAVANPDVFIQDATTIWEPSKASYWFKVPKTGGDYSGEAAGATPGTHGAVLAVNAGMVRNEFYRRQLVLEPGATYKVSAAFYVVNQTVNARFEAQQSQTGQILGSSPTLTFLGECVNFHAKLTQVFHSNLTRLGDGFRELVLSVPGSPRYSWQCLPSCS